MHPASWLSRLIAPPGCADPDKLRGAVEGKVVLLTGASFGIGAALAVRLGAAGARLLLAARSQEELQAVAASAGAQAQAYPLNLASPEEVDSVAQQILEQHGGVDVVIHNAGKSIRRSLWDSLDRAHDFQRTMNVNYLGPVRLQLALLPSLKARGGGHIINVSSVGVRLPAAPLWAAYQASKVAFDLWIAAAVPELKHHGITCTSVYLGLVHTRMSAPTASYRNMPGQTPDQAAQVICRALIRRPRSLGPWWLEPARWVTGALERPLEQVHGWLNPPRP
jgi:NAD(P)-dependent dehydrogenase (short-subunit alcohol dehydrogenase family)